MKQTDYWFVTILGTVAVLVGLFLWMRVPVSEQESGYVDLTATSSAMVVSQMRPTQGSLQGGDSVLIQGEHFPEEVEVLFGEKLAIDVTRHDETAIVVTTPSATTAGQVEVSVFGPDGEVAVAPVLFDYVH